MRSKHARVADEGRAGGITTVGRSAPPGTLPLPRRATVVSYPPAQWWRNYCDYRNRFNFDSKSRRYVTPPPLSADAREPLVAEAAKPLSCAGGSAPALRAPLDDLPPWHGSPRSQANLKLSGVTAREVQRAPVRGMSVLESTHQSANAIKCP